MGAAVAATVKRKGTEQPCPDKDKAMQQVNQQASKQASKQMQLDLPRMRFGRGIWESIRIAISSLRANKLRTILTMLGIIIGVASVVALLAIGNGATASVTERISSIGTNLLSISPGQAGRRPGEVSSQAQSLTMADAEALASLPGVAAIAPVFQGSAQVIAGANNSQSTVMGVNTAYFGVRNLTIHRGNLLSAEQVTNMASVAVLGSVVAEDLFGQQNPVGNSIRIDTQIFQVIGVLAESGSSGPGSSTDEQVFIPIGVAQLKLFGARFSGSSSLRISSISLQVESPDQVDNVAALVKATLRQLHGLSRDGSEDDFNVFNQTDLLESLNEVTGIMTTFLGAIAGISLFVGGIGVMNIMLVSVTERTREIGLRKAVGARRSDIMQQFLIEALLVSVIGGIIGVALGLGIIFIVKATGILTPVVTLPSIVMALSFSLAVGLFFGIYPARRAARLRPIEALRYE